jgi:hypothetical protein
MNGTRNWSVPGANFSYIFFRGIFLWISWERIFRNFFCGKFQFFPNIFRGKFSAEFSPEKMYEKSSPDQVLPSSWNKIHLYICHRFSQWISYVICWKKLSFVYFRRTANQFDNALMDYKLTYFWGLNWFKQKNKLVHPKWTVKSIWYVCKKDANMLTCEQPSFNESVEQGRKKIYIPNDHKLYQKSVNYIKRP